MLAEAVYHRPKQNWAYAYDHETLHIRIRTKRGDVERADLMYGDKCLPWSAMEHSPMIVLASDERFDYWETAVKPSYGRMCYGFRLRSGAEELWVTEDAIGERAPERHLGLFEFPFLNRGDVFMTPSWVKDAVFYQIFPERFANGDPANDPPGTEPWGGEPGYTNFFGGDLDGIRLNLDHLAELGITALYLTPVFMAPSNHKYDTADYRNIDPAFGSEAALKALVKACHARGLKIVLDAVFNHCGVTFPPFQDVIRNGEGSRYKDWFHIRDWPIRVNDGVPSYHTFAFEATMPKLNTEHPEVREYLLETAEYWIREVGIDGWRLDVANEVDHGFWRAFRERVKRANPEDYILGEVWHDSIPWLQGDQFDGVMNYPYSRAVLDYFVFGSLDARRFADRIGGLLARYPKQANEACLNLLGSHDTVRLLTLCEGDKRRMGRALAFLFTSVGVPCVYYGDEVGLDGEFDPYNRKCMEWAPDKQDRTLFELVKGLIRIRKQYACLRTGTLRFRQADSGSGLLVFERRLGEQAVLVAIHNGGNEAEVCLPARGWREIASSGGAEGALAPGEWKIWAQDSTAGDDGIC